MTDKNDKIQKQNETSLAIPDYIEKENKGTESLGSKDVIIPRLKIIQALSDEKVDLNIPEGNFVNGITKESFGTKIDIVIIMATSGWLMFEGKGRQAKVVSRKFKGDIFPALNEKLVLDPKNQAWDNATNTPPKANLVYTYIVIVNGRDMLSFSLMKTGLKAAKNLNTMLKMKNCPSYAQRFTAETVLTKNEKGAYYLPKFTPAGFVTKEEYETLASKFETLSTSSLNVDFENGESDDESAAAKKEEKF